MSRTHWVATVCAVALLASASASLANTSHAGWPKIDGMLLTNKSDAPRPLDARPGHDPFGSTDGTYSCDSVHRRGPCQRLLVRCPENNGGICTPRALAVSAVPVHNELLGGHGDDDIHAGPQGDVIWGDYKPSGQPSVQNDRLTGGEGRDFIYASHGTNTISAGGGRDHIKAHFGHGAIDCGAGRDILYVSRRSRKHYDISNCETLSFRSLGF
ncbi:MAG: hypothetical protein QOE11_1084 [Solirubrobacteraceae bacterium]|jgi:hypothetical protein|nr:hypothetical protein [Solirubrobacteraceae bacterium]